MLKSHLLWGFVAVVALGLGRSMLGSAPVGSVRDNLVGAWRLVSMENQGPDGKTVKLERTGILIYSRDGHMAVEIMAPPGAAAEGGPVNYEAGGFEAYFGTYSVEEETRTVTHHVEGALVRSLVHKDLSRVYRFSGKQLILKSSRSDEHWEIVWERY